MTDNPSRLLEDCEIPPELQGLVKVLKGDPHMNFVCSAAAIENLRRLTQSALQERALWEKQARSEKTVK